MTDLKLVPEPENGRVRETVNEYGTPVVEFRCKSCGEKFTVCPAPKPEEDDQWQGCQAEGCESYDAKRDIDKYFEDWRVRMVGNRVIPFDVVEGDG